MKIAIAGASGLIGSHLVKKLGQDGHSLLLFSRSFNTRKHDSSLIKYFQGDLREGFSSGYLEGIDALVNLAGVRIKSRRWSRSHRQEIYDSRIISTRNLVSAIKACAKPPSVFISASATGFYGSRGNELLDENAGKGQGFLADLAADWEAEAMKASEAGSRVVLLRTAPVLSAHGGALAEIVKSFRPGFSSVLGSGSQWFPWIHIKDETGIVEKVLNDPSLSGPLNAVAPDSRTNREFMKAVADQLNKRLFLNIPEPVLKLMLGEVAEEMLLASQRVKPEKILNAGYRFRFPTLESALDDILKLNSQSSIVNRQSSII